MKRVIAFGTFDPLHEGHKDFFRQAKMLGEHLLVIVARDSTIRALKGHEPYADEDTRVAAVANCEEVDEVQLGTKDADRYALLGELTFDVVALGYDQQPDDETVRRELDARGKQHVSVVRLNPYQPEIYKSSRLRK